MAVPKRKTSKARRDKRRAANIKQSVPTLSTCTNCSALVPPHRVCPECGYYKGEQILEPKE